MFTLPTALVALMGCQPAPMNLEEVKEALAMMLASAEGEDATTSTIEVTTDFTIGDAVEAAAEELRAFWASQAPCTEVTRDGATVTVDYGTLADSCTYKGRTYAGIHRFTVASTERLELEVDHDWQDFTNGEVTVNGTADVTWSGNDNTRNVVHALTWTGQHGEIFAEGDRVQQLIEPAQGLLGGVRIDGDRTWHRTQEPDRIWTLFIDAIEVRLQDPAPQAGTYTLQNPDGKQIGVSFERQDEATIRVKVSGAREDYQFDIGLLGVPRQVE